MSAPPELQGESIIAGRDAAGGAGSDRAGRDDGGLNGAGLDSSGLDGKACEADADSNLEVEAYADSNLEVEAYANQVQRVLEVVADAIVTVDEGGSITGMNAAAETLFGIAAADMPGRHYAVLLPEFARISVPTLLNRSQASRGLDAEARDAAGRAIPIHMTISVVAGAGEKQFIFAIRDFRFIRAAQQRVLASQRLAAIGETMTALAHESRNALQRIQSCLTLLQLKTDSDEVEALVADMQDAQDQLQRLYEEVNSFAAPMQLCQSVVDLSPMLDRTWRQVRHKWKAKQLVLSKRTSIADARVRVDAERIGQVFRNLLENAIDASHDAGHIQIDIAEEQLEDRGGVLVTVQDEGDGIPPEALDRVFDLLFTTKDAGTGMGLSIANRIVHEHDGRLTVLNTGPNGTTMAVWLPGEGDRQSRRPD